MGNGKKVRLIFAIVSAGITGVMFLSALALGGIEGVWFLLIGLLPAFVSFYYFVKVYLIAECECGEEIYPAQKHCAFCGEKQKKEEVTE